jgi:hypothetical protein
LKQSQKPAALSLGSSGSKPNNDLARVVSATHGPSGPTSPAPRPACDGGEPT